MFLPSQIEKQIAAINRQIATGKVKNIYAAKQKIKNLQVKAMKQLRQQAWEQHLAR